MNSESNDPSKRIVLYAKNIENPLKILKTHNFTCFGNFFQIAVDKKEGSLFRISKSQRPGMLFSGNTIIHDGGIYIINKLNPALFLINYLWEENKNAGKTYMRSLHDILHIDFKKTSDIDGLHPVIVKALWESREKWEDKLKAICTFTDAGDDNYYSFSKDKLTAYLLLRLEEVKEALIKSTNIFEDSLRDSNSKAKSALDYSIQIFSQFLHHEIIGELLSSLKLTIDEVTGKKTLLKSMVDAQHYEDKQNQGKPKKNPASKPHLAKGKSVKKPPSSGSKDIMAFFKPVKK